jgi:transposase
MLADSCDVVIGVDTHRDTHTLAAVVVVSGGVLATRTVRADPDGYQAALAFADEHAPSRRRAWALEGTGSYGAGLARVLVALDERVFEIDRPNKSTKRTNGKSDELDAIRAARTALGRERLAIPRVGVTHDALRVLLTARHGIVDTRTETVNRLRAHVETAPDGLRERLRGKTLPALLRAVRALRQLSDAPADVGAVILVVQMLARQIEQLSADADQLEREMQMIVSDAAPQLLAQCGVGTISAAQLLVSRGQPGRIRSQAAFAQLAGAAPIPASSGLTQRHRLNRGGDRQLNRALYTIAISRRRHDPETRAYYDHLIASKKTHREALRCLKRALARRLYNLLEHPQPTPPTSTMIGSCS